MHVLRIFAAGLMLLLPLGPASQARAAGTALPSWMTWDAANKQVELSIKAAYNGNNGSWNYNGYYDGGVTVVVPLGARVLVRFENLDGNYRHSLLVTRAYAEGEFPDQAGREEVAISRAYTRSPTQGCLSCKEDLRFKAKKAGRYYLYCGVAGHGPAGMWIGFEISETAAEPGVTIAEGALGPDDQPAWQ